MIFFYKTPWGLFFREKISDGDGDHWSVEENKRYRKKYPILFAAAAKEAEMPRARFWRSVYIFFLFLLFLNFGGTNRRPMPNLGKRSRSGSLMLSVAIIWERTFLRAISYFFVYFYLAYTADIRLGKKGLSGNPLCARRRIYISSLTSENPPPPSQQMPFLPSRDFADIPHKVREKREKTAFPKIRPSPFFRFILFFLRDFYDFERKGETFQRLFSVRFFRTFGIF